MTCVLVEEEGKKREGLGTEEVPVDGIAYIYRLRVKRETQGCQVLSPCMTLQSCLDEEESGKKSGKVA